MSEKENISKLQWHLQEKYLHVQAESFGLLFKALVEETKTLANLRALTKDLFNSHFILEILEDHYYYLKDFLLKHEIQLRPYYKKYKNKNEPLFEPTKYIYKRNKKFQTELDILYKDAKEDLTNKIISTVHIIESTKAQTKKRSNYNYFTWRGTPEQLEALYNGLVSKDIITKANGLEIFKKAFSATKLNEALEIVWLEKDVLLAYLLEQLKNLQKIPIGTEYNSIIKNNRIFIDSSGNTFKNLKGAKTNYLNNKTGRPVNANLIDEIILALP